ncbi:efflux RND transporter periplasmic adaptor subunit [Alloalcanivorax sp. C16-2]|uniref:efflux RND transporter periplasmic adaptor subunit n=1 Tax=Alloalcanivorax sp. C16-2 TaxID=3390052 RepID=UPI003970BE3A
MHKAITVPRAVSLVVALLLAGAGAVAKGAGPAVPVVTGAVTEQPRDRSTEFVARVRAIEAVDVRAQVEGVIAEVAFTGGEQVEEGDLLFSLDPRRYEAALAAAEAGLARARASRDNARQNHERMRTLARRGTVSRASLDEAEAALRVAEAEVQTAEAQVRAARLDLADTHLPSPITGQISAPALTRGNLAGPGSGALARVVRTDPVYVAFDLPEGQVVSLRQRYGPLDDLDPASVSMRLRLPNNSLYPGHGTLAVVGNEINPGTGLLGFLARFDNPDGLLVPGQYVTLLIGAARAESAPLVPQSAVLRDREGEYVFVIDDQGVARQRRIVTGERHDRGWFVRDGLSAGERVVVQGTQRLADGVPVTESEAGPAGNAAPEQP